MKTLNRICQVLCIVFGLGALALFFFNFANITFDGKKATDLAGSVLAFGANTKIGDTAVTMLKSGHLLFCLLVTAFGFVMSIFSFKKKGLRYATSLFSVVAAVYMLVIRLSNPENFINANAKIKSSKEILSATSVKFSCLATYLTVALVLFAAFAIAYLLIDDKIEVLESKGAKKTIFARIGLFFRDYKSEVKKIVWPSFRDVAKNTLIVLIMCLLVGALIWLLDWGLGSLIKVILNVK
ncbi:MAG: preprotein translocase subunit SecE [Clostridia bacterium]|nr:preprotein translocase subunit SecE [Clostridia bacterium]